jgi:NAD/NADP transhydrogenase beta subunit
VEHVAREQHQVGPLGEQIVHRPAKGVRDVRLALVPAARRLPLVLAEAEVQVGEVGDAQGLQGSSSVRSVSR